MKLILFEIVVIVTLLASGILGEDELIHIGLVIPQNPLFGDSIFVETLPSYQAWPQGAYFCQFSSNQTNISFPAMSFNDAILGCSTPLWPVSGFDPSNITLTIFDELHRPASFPREIKFRT